MKKGIKQLKPRLQHTNSQGKLVGFKQGFFDSYNPLKYIGTRPIIYRSSWELYFMQYCEKNELINQWGSEITEIPYSDCNGGRHTYYVDFTVKLKDGKVLLVEVKPAKDIPRSSMDIRTDQRKAQNFYKWRSARQYAAMQHNTEFVIITEDFFRKLNIKV